MDSRDPGNTAPAAPAPDARAERTVLKRNARRSVWLERRPGGEELVVKRFHHPGLLYRLRDRARARAELALLGRLHAAGVSVPRPRAARPAAHGWQVEMDWIPGAVSWLELLRGSDAEAARRARSGRLAAALGRLLARLHELGVDHADLHPGNVLLAPDGRPWAIDFHKSRLRGELDAGALRRDLVALAAGLRERAGVRFRARALLAWSRALPEHLRALLPADRALGAEVEHAARTRRRAEVRRAARRWTRESASCRVVALEGARAFLARELPDEVARGLAATGSAAGAHVLRGPLAELLPRWLTAVRLLDHGVPALRPLCLVERPAARGAAVAAFGLAGARQWPEAPAAPDLSACELGALLGALHDRGLRAAVAPDDLFADERGGLRLAPSVELAELEPLSAGDAAARFAGLAPPLAAAADEPVFRAAYLAAFRGGRAERERLAAELAR